MMTTRRNPRVWYLVPTANPDIAAKTLPQWAAAGYGLAIWTDPDAEGYEHWRELAALRSDPDDADAPPVIVISDEYPGYYEAVNSLYRSLRQRPDWAVYGGDDIYPDPDRTADEIAASLPNPDGVHVIQPIGDLYGKRENCPSAWLSRGWCMTAYEGNGPLPKDYFGFFGDTEVYEVAKAAGVLIERDDLMQYHAHHRREKRPRPNFGNYAKYAEDEALFAKRKAAGFPGVFEL